MTMTTKASEDSEETYAELLNELSSADYRELTQRKLDCIMQGIERIWEKLTDDELEVPPYPFPHITSRVVE